MTYTPTDQLPSPPQWMLDEVAVAEQAHLIDLMNQCFTIQTFRDNVLPIYYRHKSATGKIMGDAIDAWKEGQIMNHEFRKSYGIKEELPWNSTRWNTTPYATFAHSYYQNIEGIVFNDGDYQKECYICPSRKMRQNALEFRHKQVRDFVAYKSSGRVPQSRLATVNQLVRTWRVSQPGVRGFWEILDAWKAMKFKKMDDMRAYEMRFKTGDIPFPTPY